MASEPPTSTTTPSATATAPVVSERPVHPAYHRPRRVWLPVFLFLATCGSTYMAWSWYSWHWTYSWVTGITPHRTDGVVYTFALLAILGTHEMGHFLQTLRYKIPASLPFFIPMPISPIGTMGAVIGMQGSEADRKQLFDIGLSGPLAGLVVAIPMIWFGLGVHPPISGVKPYLGEPLIWQWFVHLRYPDIGPDQVVPLNPYTMAGWVGLLVTGLNMFPISQLDGGHVSYALFGRRAVWLARALIMGGALYMVVTNDYRWILMLILLLMMGAAHPPTADDTVPLGTGRTVLGYLSLSIPVLCFTPVPLHL